MHVSFAEVWFWICHTSRREEIRTFDSIDELVICSQSISQRCWNEWTKTSERNELNLVLVGQSKEMYSNNNRCRYWISNLSSTMINFIGKKWFIQTKLNRMRRNSFVLKLFMCNTSNSCLRLWSFWNWVYTCSWRIIIGCWIDLTKIRQYRKLSTCFLRKFSSNLWFSFEVLGGWLFPCELACSILKWM